MNLSPQYSGNYVHRLPSQAIAQFMSRVYGWMSLGILLTAFVAFQMANSPAALQFIFGSPLAFWGIIILQFGAVIYLSAAIQKINAWVASALYLGYSALTGVTLSAVLLVYTQQSVASAFVVTSFAFAGLSAWGFITRRDLGPVGSFCIMGLFGLVGISLLSIFVPSLMGEVAQKTMGAIGVIVFSGLTAYDTQRIKSFAVVGQDEAAKKSAITGALMLYLDFLNLFISLLRLFGSRR